MTYKVLYMPSALKDLYKLDNSQQTRVLKAIKKVSQNPLPNSKGGLGKPLGTKNNSYLTGYFKIKLKKDGIRIVYKLIEIDHIMYIVIIDARSDDEVYIEANKRKQLKEK